MKKLIFFTLCSIVCNLQLRAAASTTIDADYGNTVSILDYGADPVAGNDDTQAIQDAVSDPANFRKIILFPAGTYRLSSTISITQSLEIRGEGEYNTIFQPDGVNGFLISSGEVKIKDLQIFGRAGSGTGQIFGIRVDGKKDIREEGGDEECIIVKNGHRGIHWCTFENLRIVNFSLGLELKYTWDTKVDKCHIFYLPNDDPSKNFIMAEGVRFYGKCVNNTITNSNIQATSYCISIYNDDPEKESDNLCHTAEGLMISDCLIAGARSGIYSEGILSLNVSNNVIDLCTIRTIQAKKTRGMLLTNNWIYSHTKSGEAVLDEPIQLEESEDNTISNNNIICAHGARGISLMNTRNTTITSNTITMHNNKNGKNVYIDSDSYNIIVKDNVLKNNNKESGASPSIINNGNANIIKDNRGFKAIVEATNVIDY